MESDLSPVTKNCIQSILCGAFNALLLLPLNAQESGSNPSPSPSQARVGALFQKIQQEILPLPLTVLPCPLQSLQNEIRELGNPEIQRWLADVKTMREQGDEKCAFQLLDELEPFAQKNKSGHLQWLFEKSRTLNAFEYQDSALTVARQLQALATKHGQFKGWANLAEAWVVHGKKQFDETLRLAQEALAIARNENDKLLEAKALGVIGRASRDLYMVVPEKNVPFHLQALEIYENLRDTAAMISELTAIGLSYDGTPQVGREFDYTEKAVALLRPNASLKSRMQCVRLLGIYLQNKGDFDRSLPLSMHSIELAKTLGDRGLTQNMYEQLAGVFMQKNNFVKALEMMDSAKTYCNFKAELGYFYQTYAEIAEKLGDRELALEYYRKAFNEQVKGYTNRNSALLTEMETRLRTRETEILLAQQKRQRWLLFGLAGALFLLFAGAFYAFLKQRQGRRQIAEQKNLIEKQADELRRLDEMKSRFFANVSHELRTPLTLVLGPIGSALKRNRLENQDFTFLKTAQTHGKSLLKLVNQILDLSKVQAGKLELQEASVALFPFLRRIVAAFESHAERQGIRFSFQYKAERGLQLQLDAPKLETILNNLLSNALKFTPSGGSVSVVVEDLAHSLRLTVSDTGRGIHPEDLPHVFDRFYQTNQPGAATEGGTGIGLALCRELVELMQGKVWAESEPDRGSSFFVEIPRKEIMGTTVDGGRETVDGEDDVVENQELGTITAPSTVSRHPSSVLVVEDNASLRDYIQTLLSERYNVLTAENGQTALEVLSFESGVTSGATQNSKLITHNLPDLILSDIMMPVMDGFQLLEKLKGDDRWRHIPVVMLTARADAQDKLRALRIGVDDYLLKPFEEEELLLRVENLLKNYRQRSADFRFTSDDLRLGEPEPATEAIVNRSRLQSGSIVNQTKEDIDWLERLEHLVNGKLSDSSLTAETLADALAMSRAQFFRQVKKLTGLTPAQYLDEARFRQARLLLETGEGRSVKAVAYEVGFRQVEHFSRQFKERFGKYPSEYLE
ncbi:MAG: response regulator [Bacteroidetes bacterium]|nr:response regulator [Bacteroidota bacterium]